MLHITGGVYREYCSVPHWDAVFGSGGRAAAALSSLARKTHLHTYAMHQDRSLITALAAAWNAKLTLHNTSESPVFDYFHALRTQSISNIPKIRQEAFNVNEEVVLRYGMLEGDCVVDADTTIYDPQSSTNPQFFSHNGSKARRLAYVLNLTEGRQLTGKNDPSKIADFLKSKEGASIVVIKLGPLGALVFGNSGSKLVAAYKTDKVFPIGSGDVFSAVFAFYWGIKRLSPTESARLASRATALYCRYGVLPISSSRIAKNHFSFSQVKGKDSKSHLSKQVYLASPLFTVGEQMVLEEARRSLLDFGLKVFSPLHDVGAGDANYVANKDLQGLRQSHVVLAFVDNLDAGTLFEIGYAYSKGIPVVALRECAWKGEFKMLEGTNCQFISDFPTAVYTAAWSAIES